ncbi:MAG: N-formylglutamate amidohydrolase, partial [Bacteroidota bacterium]
DEFHTDQKLVDFSVDFFKSKGFTLGINWPYAGSIVPMEHYRKNKNVGSIMLEINRSFYLKDLSNLKSERFLEIKSMISEFIQKIKSCYFFTSNSL